MPNSYILLHTHRHIYTCPGLVNNHVINNYEVKCITTALRRTYSARSRAECLPKMDRDGGQLLPAASLGPRNECQSSPSPANCSGWRCGQWETALWSPSAKEAQLCFGQSLPCTVMSNMCLIHPDRSACTEINSLIPTSGAGLPNSWVQSTGRNSFAHCESFYTHTHTHMKPKGNQKRNQKNTKQCPA